MAWIELHDTLPDHPKTLATSSALRIDKDLLIGKLCRLWTWCLSNRENGFIADNEIDTVAEIMRWSKKSKALFDALCVVPVGFEYGFLEVVDGGYLIHDWDERIEMLRDKREERRQQARLRKQRQRDKVRDKERDCHDGEVDDERDCHADVTRDKRDSHAVTVPNRTLPYLGNDTADDADARARADDPLEDTEPHDEAETALREVLLEFIPCGLSEPNHRTQESVMDLLILPDYGLTIADRKALILRAMKEVALAPKEKRSFGTVIGLLRHWKKNGSTRGNNHSPPAKYADPYKNATPTDPDINPFR